MEEVIIRRLKHSIENPKGGFGELPDVIFADGGITQIRAVQSAIQKVNDAFWDALSCESESELQISNTFRCGVKKHHLEEENDFRYGGKNYDQKQNKRIEIPVFGMVKNDKHQTRALMDDQKRELEISPNLMKVITNFQDTVHDTAITYHRKLRDKQITKSALDEINGIGEAKKQALLKHFGSVEKIKQASQEELMQVKGISKSLAQKILED